MLDDQELEQQVQEIITELCCVMFQRGYKQVNVGAIMRMVGVPNERASDYDDEFVVNDSDFWNQVGETQPRPPSSTLH